MSPSALATALLIGMILGLIPFPLVATLLCAALALVLRLNMGVIQLGNYLMYPFQLLLMIPLMEWGNALLGGRSFPWDYEQLAQLAEKGIMPFADAIGQYLWGGLLMWVLIIVIPGALCYPLLVRVFRRMKRKRITDSQS